MWGFEAVHLVLEHWSVVVAAAVVAAPAAAVVVLEDASASCDH